MTVCRAVCGSTATSILRGVSPATWTCAIGGYRPAEKWLKDCKDRALSFDDITHYRTLCAALTETPDLMSCIDETVAVHGGWSLTWVQ